jgi:phasin family protein
MVDRGQKKQLGGGIKRCGVRSSYFEFPEVRAGRDSTGGNMTEVDGKKVGFLAYDGTNSGFRFSRPEVELMFASQRKNVDAMVQVNRLTLDGIHAVWCRQLDFIQKALGGFTTHIRDVATPGGPSSEKLAKYMEYSKQAFERSLANAHELADLVNKATGETMNVINKRFCEGAGEWRHPSEKRSDETTSV